MVQLVRAVLLVLHLQYLLLTWKSRGGADFETDTHGLTEAQAREIITELRQGIGLDLDSLIARVGAIESQEHQDFLLPENAESVKLQANQGSNEFLH